MKRLQFRASLLLCEFDVSSEMYEIRWASNPKPIFDFRRHIRLAWQAEPTYIGNGVRDGRYAKNFSKSCAMRLCLLSFHSNLGLENFLRAHPRIQNSNKQLMLIMAFVSNA